MAEFFFLIAGGLSLVWLGVHLLVGGRQVAGPLMSADDLEPVVRTTQYLCWHYVSFMLAAMAGLFFATAAGAGAGLALSATITAAGFTLLGLAMAPILKTGYGTLPQGWLFLPITLLGAAGLLA